MPMLTMSVIRWPLWPRHAPLRTDCDERRHARQHVVDVGHDVAAVDQDRPVAAVAQRHVQHGAVLGVVDLCPLEHHGAPVLDVGMPGEIEQQPHGAGVDAVLAVVEQQILEPQRQLAEALGVGREQVAQAGAGHVLRMSLQRLPGGGGGQCRHLRSPRWGALRSRAGCQARANHLRIAPTLVRSGNRECKAWARVGCRTGWAGPRRWPTRSIRCMCAPSPPP